MMKTSSKESPTNEELIALGKKLQAFYDSGYVNRKQALYFSFLKGIAAGFGAFLGGTLVVVLILWILSLFNQAPFVGPIVESLNKTLTK
jgi:hypothetical protein